MTYKKLYYNYINIKLIYQVRLRTINYNVNTGVLQSHRRFRANQDGRDIFVDYSKGKITYTLACRYSMENRDQKSRMSVKPFSCGFLDNKDLTYILYC